MTISRKSMGTYNAIAEYVSANQVDDLQGVSADEISEALGIPKPTVYRTLKMPGFFKTVRPVTSPRAYGFDPGQGIITTTKIVAVKQAEIAKTNKRGEITIDTHFGKVIIAEVQPSIVLDKVLGFCLATGNVAGRANELVTTTNALNASVTAFINGDAEALNPETDKEWVSALAKLVTACRTISELGQDILNSNQLRTSEYWTLFATPDSIRRVS